MLNILCTCESYFSSLDVKIGLVFFDDEAFINCDIITVASTPETHRVSGVASFPGPRLFQLHKEKISSCNYPKMVWA